jgi:hypothetical protein
VRRWTDGHGDGIGAPVSIEVALADLGAVVADRGELAYLVTVGDLGPRVVSVSVTHRPAPAFDGDEPRVALVMEVGRHTAANVAARPQVTLLWPPDEADPAHSLLVDGLAAVEGAEVVVVTPAKAIRHRIRAGHGRPAQR